MLLFIFASLFSQCTHPPSREFSSAIPIWAVGLEKEKNITVGFRTVFSIADNDNVVLRITGSSVYRIFVNGKFSGYGPARGPHNYYRIDEWDISKNIVKGDNLLAIEVAGYNVNSYYLLDQPSFIQAEIISGGKVLASTGSSGADFEATVIKERVQKVQRYSFQRPFSEVYRLKPNYNDWRNKISANFERIKSAVISEKNYLPRRVPYPEFSLYQPLWDVSYGKMEKKVSAGKIFKDRSLTAIGPNLKGFTEKELEVIPSIELQKISSIPTAEINKSYEWGTKLNLKKKSYHILDFGTNLTGFIGARINCKENTKLYFTFDEILSDGDINFNRLTCVNIVGYEMPSGVYEVETFEPYTLRYLKLIVVEGDCDIDNIYLRDYANPEAYKAHFAASDERLNKLFSAGRETFRQNAVDIFSDCPSRERAGWLCDSYFTGRAGFDLCGNTTIEKNFIENFLIPKKFAYHPDGMLPMCYPADHYNGMFIPNWALWFVVELEEYLQRSGDRQTVDALKPKVLNLFDYFKKFKNEDGLLEKLESWVFVEWSEANKFVQDVNYPSNMLFAGALSAASRMYNMEELSKEAEKIREVIRKQSFDGEFFVDNAVRKNGELEVTRNRTEVCQYFAFYFDVADTKNYSKLWNNLKERFGPQRKMTKAFPEVFFANAFIGNVLRLEILSRYGLSKQILDESIEYLLYMENRTGTLWEDIDPSESSLNHGFASHIIHVLYRDVLGIYQIDTINKIVKLRFSDVKLDWCEGIIPTVDGNIKLNWKKEGNKILYQVNVPAGYKMIIENIGGSELSRQL